MHEKDSHRHISNSSPLLRDRMWTNRVHNRRERLASGGRIVRGQSVRIIARKLFGTTEQLRECVSGKLGQPSG